MPAPAAALKLALASPRGERETRLEAAIPQHGDAWCDGGTQVGALARAHLAIHSIERGRYEQAERLAAEIASRLSRRD